jgi:DNA primase
MEISDIKLHLTLSQLLQYYGLKPDKNGRLNCPFHEDKTPSLQVYYKTGTVYCFSSNCPTHGHSMDTIEIVQRMEKADKHQALLKCVEIIEYYQGKISHQHKPVQTKPSATLTIPKEQFLQNMFTYFKNAVHNSKPAQEYIKSRGLDPVRLEIGYNTAQFHHGQRRDETLISNCVAVGLLAPWGVNNRKPEEQAHKAFGKECIVFAMRNPANQITGLYFRSTTNNGNQKHYYLKESIGLYPGYPNPATEKLIIAESIIDAASLLQIEAINKQYSILAAYGTNRLNDEMKSCITGLTQLKEIIFAFDNDEAGNKAAAKYKEELQALVPVVKFTKLILPNKDVNETLQAHNEEIFIQLINDRTTDLSFSNEKENNPESNNHLPFNQHAPQGHPSPLGRGEGGEGLDVSNPYKLRYTSDTAIYYIQGGLPKTTDNLKVMLVIEALHDSPLGVGGKARNKIDLYEDKQVEKLCKEVAEKLDLRRDLLEADLYRLTDLLETHIDKELRQHNDDAKPLQVLTVKERTELESFAKKPKLIKRLNEMLGQTGIVGEDRNRIFLLIIAISHKMPETLHALIQGSSGSGKTRLLKQVSDCIPKESVTKLTRLSDKVLYNFPESYFMNRLLCLEDIDGLSEEAEFAFRELQSNGELNSATSIKLDNGQITSGQKTVKGPIASMSCTTKGEIYEDNMSRVFLIAVDETAEQTRRIIEYQNKKAAGLIDYKKEAEIKIFLQKFVGIIEAKEVINPFAEKIQLPEEAHKIRRLNDLFQSFVKMVTVLNQYQRKTDNRKRLITEIDDIETAIHIMFESIVLKVDELDGSLRQFYEKLKSFAEKKGKAYEFNRFEVREATGLGKTQQHHYLTRLVALEYMQQTGFANRGFKYKITHWDNHSVLRSKIQSKLKEQVVSLKAEHQPNANRTPEPPETIVNTE